MKLQHSEVRYEVTDNCNANCIMCPREKHTRPHGVMDNTQYKASIDEVSAMGAVKVVLTGFGEPMLDTGLEEKISYAKTKGLRTYIISNGSALTAKRAKSLINAGLDEIRISFYGMSEQSYNSVMTGLDYIRAVSNIKGFLKVRRQMKASIKIQLSYLVLPENEHETQRFIDYWADEVDYLEVWKPHNFGDGKDFRERGENKRTCGRPANGPLQIQWNGEVIPCCYDYNNQIVLGNAFDTPVDSVLHSKEYNALREAHINGNFQEFPYCDQCDQLLPHDDVLVYSNRHNLTGSEAVKLSNTDLHNLEDNKI